MMKEYAIEQRRFNEKFFGRGTRSIDSVEGLMNKYAREGWVLHSIMTAPTRDEKTQLTTMVFERDVPGTPQVPGTVTNTGMMHNPATVPGPATAPGMMPAANPAAVGNTVQICPKCGNRMQPDAVFCGNCGFRKG